MESPNWTGDLDDDGTALWKGLMLRAEEMDEAQWWWAVTIQGTGKEIGSYHDDPRPCNSSTSARQRAEQCARDYLTENST